MTHPNLTNGDKETNRIIFTHKQTEIVRMMQQEAINEYKQKVRAVLVKKLYNPVLMEILKELEL